MPTTVLLIDDDEDVLFAAAAVLEPEGHRVRGARGPDEARALLAAEPAGVVLLDLNFRRGDTQGEEGLAFLAELRARHPLAVVVVVTAHAGVAQAVRAMREGASDFVSKPWSHERLLATVHNAAELHATRRSAHEAEQRAAELGQPAAALAPAVHGLVGASPAIEHVRSLIDRVAPSDANVLVLGENGTGKELVAAALHRASARRHAPLVTLDMGALPATLFESELFGHRKGAFTDARSDRVGRFAAAHRGTLFLDEIGNLPLALQPKLLAALERREVRPLGGSQPLAVDVRVISATNLSRDALADERQFRPDLLWRLNTVEIHVPPLRQRREDIPLLAAHFLALYRRKYGKPPLAFTAAARAAMQAHAWPGNVRALRNAVERAVVMAAGDEITPADLALAPEARSAHARSDGTPAAEGGAAAEDLNLERAERALVERALDKHAWNISLAARELGLTRASLYRRMQRHGL
jgi:DNA-binding NtrC family response regulator